MTRLAAFPAVAALGLFAATAVAQQQQQAPLTFDQPAQTAPPAQLPAAQLPLTQPPLAQPPVANPAQPVAIPAVLADPNAAAASGAPLGPVPPPFVLTPDEARYVEVTLQQWEKKSAEINTYRAEFARYDYDETFGPQGPQAMWMRSGFVSYSKPDRGSFKIESNSLWTKTDPNNPLPDAPGEYVPQKDVVGEHWVCDGPLPFLFGAEATKLLERYWIRPFPHDKLIHLQAVPKRQSDAMNYDVVEVMLNPQTMYPVGIQMVLPGGKQKYAYAFKEPTVNSKLEALFGDLFKAPTKPLGWERVVMNEAEAAPGQQAANPGATAPR
jgi:hypothetical protein